MKTKIISGCLALLLNIQNAMAGGFSWSCKGERFSASWNGKPFRPLNGEIDMTFIPQELNFLVKVDSVEELEGRQAFHLSGDLSGTPVQAILEAKGLTDIQMSVLIDGKIEENIKCGLF